MSTDTTRAPVARNLTVPAVLSSIVAALLVGVSIGGLAFGQRGLYEPDPRTLPAFLGQDAITLVVGLPLLVIALALVRRGSTRGVILWTGALFYVVYSYAYYLFGMAFNPLFLAYVLIASLSTWALLWLLAVVDPAALKARFRAGLPVRRIGGFLVGLSAMFVLMWFGGIAGATAAGKIDPVFRLVTTLDLTLPLPAMIVGGILLWRRHPWGYALSGMLLVKMAFLGATLVLTSWLATFWGTPLDPLVPFYVVIGVGGLIGSAIFLKGVD